MRRAVAVFAVVLACAVLAACGGGGDGGSQQAFCERVRAGDVSNLLKGITPFASKEQMKAAIEQAVRKVDDAAKVAPKEVKDDVTAVKDALAKGKKALEDADYDLAKVDQTALAALITGIDPNLKQIQAYAKDSCGVDLTTPSVPTSTP